MGEETEISMLGGGYYNANCSLQEMAIDKSFELFDPIEFNGTSITLADYGCSEGRNSLPSISSATLVYNDTPLNDFSSLSLAIDANQTVTSRGKKLQIYPLMVPKSYFQRVVPNEFVHVGFSFTALHWTQQMPTDGDNTVGSALPSVSANRDLVAFLAARYEEIHHGGHLVLCIPGAGPVGVEPALRCLETVLQQLSTKYHISPSATSRLPLYFRSLEEILTAVEDTRGKWRVVKAADIPMEHPSWAPANCDTNGHCADSSAKEKYAHGITGFTLAAVSGFMLKEVRSNTEAFHQKHGGHVELDEDAFLHDLTTGFTAEFLQSHSSERVGFTYAFVKLEKPNVEK